MPRTVVPPTRRTTASGANAARAATVEHYDVVVVGGGSAGVSAAVGAARCGARTVLVERYGFLGGCATVSNVLSYCGFFSEGPPPEQVVRGVGNEVLERLGSLGRYSGPYRIPNTNRQIVMLDPEAVKRVLDDLVTESGAHLLLHTLVVGASRVESKVTVADCANFGSRFKLTADAWVDASGDACLVELAGGTTELHEERMTGSLILRISGFDVGADTSATAFESAVRAGKAAGISPLIRDRPAVFALGPNDLAVMAVDVAIDGPLAEGLTSAELSGRRQASAYMEAYRRFLPGFERAYLISTGPQVGIRETRHPRGRYVVTEADVRTAARHPHSIAKGAWPIEIVPRPGQSSHESVAGGSFYSIPYNAIVSYDLENVFLSGRAVSCDSIAYGSIRVMGTAFATGHAAGVAAAGYARIGQHDVEATRQNLLTQGASL